METQTEIIPNITPSNVRKTTHKGGIQTLRQGGMIYEAQTVYRAVGRYDTGEPLTTPLMASKAVWAAYRDLGLCPTREHFLLFTLDMRCRIIAVHPISSGNVAASLVDMHLLVRAVANDNAKKVIVAHNHPTGICEPSFADNEVTRSIKRVLDCMGVNLEDHIISGFPSQAFVSMNAKGLI